MGCRYASPGRPEGGRMWRLGGRKATVGAALILVGGFTGAGVASTTAGAATAQPSVVSACTEAGLKAAVAAGGTVTFSCSGTILLTSPIVVTSGQNVAIDGAKHKIVLSGGHKTQLFVVDGGTLTLRRVTLTNGAVRG